MRKQCVPRSLSSSPAQEPGNETSTKDICVVRHVSTADSKTETLCLLLTASNSLALYCLYVVYPAVMSWAFQIPRIVADLYLQ